MAQTPVGYGLHMLEIFDLTESQLIQQQNVVKQKIEMEQSLMMQSAAMNASMAIGPSLTGYASGMATSHIPPPASITQNVEAIKM